MLKWLIEHMIFWVVVEGISSDYNEIVVGTHSAWLMAVFGVTME